MKVRHVVDPAKYRKKYYPGSSIWGILADPGLVPFQLMLNKLNEHQVSLERVRWMEDGT